MNVLPDPAIFVKPRARRKLSRLPEAWIIAALLIAAYGNAIALVV